MVNKRLEKYALFSKGFRGLPDGWHNLRACNFLVGENSTGKSSFLQLIQLIDSREHMVLFDICGVVDGIDTAFDVCSRLANCKETTIGFLIKERPDEDRKSYRGTFGRLATYRKVNEEMQLQRLTMVSGDSILRLKRNKDRISYRFDALLYNSEISHAENGRQVESLHFKTGDRFRNHYEVVWPEVPEIAAWHEALNHAVFKSGGKKERGILNSYSPLRCLHHGPIRAQTRRLYHGSNSEFSSTGEHTPFLLRDMLNEGSELGQSIEDFGAASGLFDRISTTSVKTEIKDKPFALQVEKSGSYFYVDELGYGVGQVLPIIADIAFTSGLHAFLIQQPELHLHPRAQAALGDVFLKSAEAGGAFVIETHSDFIIDRYRLKHKQSNKNPKSQIIYFEKTQDGTNRAHEIELNSDGTMGDIPASYRSFFLNESIDKFENF